MKLYVFVYGTLKSGYGNNRLLSTSRKVCTAHMHGHKLYNSGFPVARRSEGSVVIGEVYEVDSENVLNRLDLLEGEGRMYHRREVTDDVYGEWDAPVHTYIGDEHFWRFETMKECRNWRDDNVEAVMYEWSR